MNSVKEIPTFCRGGKDVKNIIKRNIKCVVYYTLSTVLSKIFQES